MEMFVARHAESVTWTLSGFDRLVLRGSLLPLMRERGMHALLARAGVRVLDFRDYALETSERVKEASLAGAERTKRPIVYLESSRTSKEDLARRLLAEQPLSKPGLICALKTVEPCMSFEYHRSPDSHERGLRLPRKCLHIYQYALDPQFGFMSARLQTWFPFNVQVCLNGREWLARQLARRGSLVHARGQLLAVGRQSGARAAPDARAARNRLAGRARRRRAPSQPAARGDLRAVADALLLVRLPDRVGDFKVLGPHHDDPEGKLYWQPLRKGVADLHRRAEVSQRSNERYLDALAAVDDTTPCSRIFDAVARPVVDGSRRFRALRIGDADDLALLHAISRGEFATAGFRNRELRPLLHPLAADATPADTRRLSAKVSRKLRLLRAHGLIRKIPKTHRYQLTDRGRLLAAALHATREASVAHLLHEAA